MKNRHRYLIISSCVVVGIALSGAVKSQEAEPTKTATENQWQLDQGYLDAGARVFITKPGTDPKDSAAKYNQYGKKTDGYTFSAVGFGVSKKDGSMTVEFMGKNLNANNQAMELDIAKPGSVYLDLGWSQSPNTRSNTAQTVFSGVGGRNLIVPDSMVQSLYQGIFNSTNPGAGNYATSVAANSTVPVTNQTLSGTSYVPKGCLLPGQSGTLACAAGVTPVQTTILNNEHRINLGIMRDSKEANYRWTLDEKWNVSINFSNEHRWGVQEQGVLFSTSTSTPMAAVPMLVDDTTRNTSMTVEYSGKSAWDKKWNFSLKYANSVYENSFSSYTVENPFGGLGSPAGASYSRCPVASATTTSNCYGIAQMGVTPSNQANMVSSQLGVDLPGFRNNRFMSTLQYNSMTQNQAFIPMTINPAATYTVYNSNAPTTYNASTMPRNSLNGQITTMLSNNVLSTQLTTDIKNKMTYRFYSSDNNTPPLTLTSWVLNDVNITTGAAANASAGIGNGSYAPHTTLFSSYAKVNASDEVNWRATSWLNVGMNAGWEQYRYSQYAANITNEYTGKVFAKIEPSDWLSVRMTNTYARRRYDNYDWQLYIGNIMQVGTVGGTPATGLKENPYLVDYNIANRDRNIGNIYVDLSTPVKGLTLTPTAGVRWDEFPVDPVISRQNKYQLGIKYDHTWNAGLEAAYVLNSSVNLSLSYNRETIAQKLLGTSSAANESTLYSTNMGEVVHTLTAGLDYQIIPDSLNFKLSGTHMLGNDTWLTGAMPGCLANNGAGTSCGIVSPGNPAYTPSKTSFDRIDAKLRYKIGTDYLNMMMVKEAYFQLHYAYELNRVKDWQTDGAVPYMYSTLNSSTVGFKDMIFLAGTNPNYHAQVLVGSFIVKW